MSDQASSAIFFALICTAFLWVAYCIITNPEPYDPDDEDFFS